MISFWGCVLVLFMFVNSTPALKDSCGSRGKDMLMLKDVGAMFACIPHGSPCFADLMALIP